MKQLHSPVKIAGGKAKLASTIVAKIPPKILDLKNKYMYFEPFLGGGAVYLNLLQQSAFGYYHLNDNNRDLASLWTYLSIAEDLSVLINALEFHSKNHSEDYFYRARERFNSLDRSQAHSVSTISLFLYLNKTCFNGLIRYNSRGEFNAPFGKYTNPRINNEEVLRNLHSVIGSNTTVVNKDFQDYIEEVYTSLPRVKKFFYLDPPYIPLSITASFTSYCPEDFTLYDQYRLAATLKLIDSRGDSFILSNSATKMTEEVFKGFNFEEIVASRSISCKGSKRQPVKEFLITNF